jgi:hypothetical protein
MAVPAHHGGEICEEAVMAAIAFDAAHRQQHIPEQLRSVQSANLTAEFRPLDAGVVSDAIPAFFIGRNMEGFWVARDADGRIGGIFLLEHSALSFARKNSPPTGCATIFPSERFELDLANDGNPLVAQVGWLKRLATAGRQRITILVGNLTGTVERRLREFHLL